MVLRIRAMRKRGIFSHCFGDGVRRRTNRPDCEIPHSPAFLLPGEENGKACNADAGRCRVAERRRDDGRERQLCKVRRSDMKECKYEKEARKCLAS